MSTKIEKNFAGLVLYIFNNFIVDFLRIWCYTISMRRGIRTNKIAMVVMAVAFVIASVIALPVVSVFEYSATDDYETFYSSFMDMVQTYDHDDIVRASSVDDGENITRIIVNSDEQIDTRGAIVTSSFDGTYFLQYANHENAEDAYEYFSTLPNVTVLYDYDVKVQDEVVSVHATYSSSATDYNSWGWKEKYNFMGVAPYLTSMSVADTTYNDVVVAVLDSGINTSHEMFNGRIVLGSGKNFTDEASSTSYEFEDLNGHGTHVSGTIVEITPSAVSILPLKVLNYKGEGKVSYIIAAIKYLVALSDAGTLNIKVANMSLGVTTSGIATDLATWINNAYSRNITSVVSAGNDAKDTATVEPANVENAITVSALKRYNTISKSYMIFDSSYSNYGSSVDFSAPGTNISSAYIGSSTAMAELSGTSMAAPHITACVALIYVNPTYAELSASELALLLHDNADKSNFYVTGTKYDLGDRSWNKYYGYGCPNIKNLGVSIVGDVDFSVSNSMQTSTFSLSLSYPENASAEIWYTTDEEVNAADLSKSSMTRYTSSLTISKSTKITAIAYLYSGAALVQRSATSTKIYYVNNYDLESNYTISSVGAITSYVGTDLTTLNIPTVIKSVTVRAIGKNAFSSANIVTLNLPNTLTTINEYAFAQNTKLKTVNCSSSSIDLGKCAFQKCTQLATFNMSGVKTIGESAFAYTAITNLFLTNATTIANNAFSASALKNLYLGKNVSSIGSQVQISGLTNVYGYNAVAQDFAYKYDANYYDMTLSISKDLPTQKIFKQGQSLTFRFEFNGYDITDSDCHITTNISSGLYSKTLTHPTLTKNILTVTTNAALSVGSYTFKVRVSDDVDSIESQTMTIKVVASSTTEYTINRAEGNYEIYVDGDLIGNSFKLYKNQTYNIAVVSQTGYNVSNIYIDGHSVAEGEYYSVVVVDDVDIELNAVEVGDFEVNFEIETDDHGDNKGYVYVDGESVEFVAIQREDNTLSFTVEGKTGYYVKRVTANGELLVATNGIYTIENILEDYVVSIIFEKAAYAIEITYVNACGTYASADLSSVDYGDSREITIYAKNGYKVDFVTVNGQVIEVKNGTFVISSVDGDKDVVVSFKRSGSAIFDDDNSAILYYFIVFAVILAMFIVARVVLFLVRKKRQEKI